MKKMASLLTFLVVVVFLAVLAGCVTIQAGAIPLPSDINIVAPDPSLPEEIQALSGKRGGKWEPVGLDCILIIEKADSKAAQVVLAIGDLFTGRYKFRANWRREQASITLTDGKVCLEVPTGTLGAKHGAKIEFVLMKDKPDVLEGKRVSINEVWFITMKKIQ